MVSVNAIGFADIISLLLQITADVSKNKGKVQHDLIFIFIELSENFDSFV